MTVERIAITSRDQWLSLRAHDITASDVPAVCGEGMFGSAAKVWAEKRGMLSPQAMTEAMKRGLWGEAAVFEAIAWEHPDWELRRAKVYLRDADARLGATPDGAAIVPGRSGLVIVQCKVVAAPVFRAHWLNDPEDDIQFGEATVPLGYQLQTLTESMLADGSCAVVAALVVDAFKWTLREFWIERHAGAEGMIREKVGAFWANYLDPCVQPPIEPERDADLVKALFPQDDGTEIDLTSDNRAPQLVADLERARADKKDAETREKIAKTGINEKMGTARFARLADGRRISNATIDRKGFVVEPTTFRMIKILGRAA